MTAKASPHASTGRCHAGWMTLGATKLDLGAGQRGSNWAVNTGRSGKIQQDRQQRGKLESTDLAAGQRGDNRAAE